MAGECIDIPLVIGGCEIRTGRRRRRSCRTSTRMCSPTGTRPRPRCPPGCQRRRRGAARMGELAVGRPRGGVSARRRTADDDVAANAQCRDDARASRRRRSRRRSMRRRELIDFWRFNVAFAQELYHEQPISTHGMWNQSDYRGLEGFVYAVTPFNFTAIGGNLPAAPGADGLHGRVEAGVERDAERALHHAAVRSRGPAAGRDQLRAGRRRRGVGRRPRSSGLRGHSLHRFDRRVQRHVAARRRNLASTAPIRASSARPAAKISSSCTRPPIRRKSPSAWCAAPSSTRAEVLGREPRLRAEVAVAGHRDRMVGMMKEIRMGDVRDFRNFMGAVIDEKAFHKISEYLPTPRECHDDRRRQAAGRGGLLHRTFPA